MFQRVGRRLALLNAIVVIAIIAMVGGITYVALKRSLDHEIDNALRDRVEVYQPSAVQVTTPTAETAGDDDDDDDDDEHDRDIVESGDTIVVAVDHLGRIVDNPRGIELEGVPVSAGIDAVLGGSSDTRSVTLEDSGSVRVMTVPVIEDGQVTGAIQAIRSLREHDAELAIVRWMTILGAGLGVLIAIPAGLYLARRAMQPINAAFERQRAFVSDASHELRTPLTLIRANADYALMDTSKSVGAVEPELAAILSEVDRTDRMVDDLLTLARSDSGRLHLNFQMFDLAQLVGKTLQGMRARATEKEVRLEF